MSKQLELFPCYSHTIYGLGYDRLYLVPQIDKAAVTSLDYLFIEIAQFLNEGKAYSRFALFTGNKMVAFLSTKREIDSNCRKCIEGILLNELNKDKNVRIGSLRWFRNIGP